MSSYSGRPEEPAESGFDRFSGTITYVVVTAIVLIAGAVWLPLFGWLVGVLFVWRGRAWLLGEKIVATVIPVVVALGAAFLLATLAPASEGQGSNPVPIDGFPPATTGNVSVVVGQFGATPYVLTGITVAVAVWLLAVGVYRVRSGRRPS